MTTVTVDDRKRVRIPDAKPKQVFALETNSDGSVTLTPVKADRKQRFPRGSLVKYFTGKLGRERDELEAALLKGTVEGPE
jgi:hypothetical protein